VENSRCPSLLLTSSAFQAPAQPKHKPLVCRHHWAQIPAP
jgi:hypothetical protein